jgi:hypothetical protein
MDQPKNASELTPAEVPLPIAHFWEDTTELRNIDVSQMPPRAARAFQGYLAELAGDADAAARHYEELSRDEAAPVRDWSYVRRASLGSTTEPELNEAVVLLKAIEERYVRKWPWLAVEAAWTMGRLFKNTPGQLNPAREALDRALSNAAKLLPAWQPGRLQLERELMGAIWIELVALLLRSGRFRQSKLDLARVPRLFRNFRRDCEFRSTDVEREAAPLAGHRLRVEFVCAPGEPIYAIATFEGVELGGFLTTHVDELSKAMHRYQSLLYAIDRQHPTKDIEWLVEVNRAVFGARKQVERMLWQPSITWGDGSQRSLCEFIGDREEVELITHGPTAIVPWPLLRRADGRCLGESAAIVCPPTDLLLTRARQKAPCTFVQEELQDGDTGMDLLRRLGRGQISWLRGHGQFTHGDPLGTMLTSMRVKSKGVTTRELLDCSGEAPLAGVSCLFASVCEAAEVHRRSVAFDFLNLGYALLVAGARTVVVPTMTVTAASDRLVKYAIDKLCVRPEQPVEAVWHETISTHLSAWRADPDEQTVEAAWRAGRPTPVDLAAFIVVQSAGES